MTKIAVLFNITKFIFQLEEKFADANVCVILRNTPAVMEAILILMKPSCPSFPPQHSLK